MLLTCYGAFHRGAAVRRCGGAAVRRAAVEQQGCDLISDFHFIFSVLTLYNINSIENQRRSAVQKSAKTTLLEQPCDGYLFGSSKRLNLQRISNKRDISRFQDHIFFRQLQSISGYLLRPLSGKNRANLRPYNSRIIRQRAI